MKSELKVVTGQLRKGLRIVFTAGKTPVTLRSIVLMEWKGPDPDAVGLGEKGVPPRGEQNVGVHAVGCVQS